MIVCHCHATSDRAIREVVQSGARTPQDVGTHCRAGTGCGLCREAILELLSHTASSCHADRSRSPLPACS